MTRVADPVCTPRAGLGQAGPTYGLPAVAAGAAGPRPGGAGLLPGVFGAGGGRGARAAGGGGGGGATAAGRGGFAACCLGAAGRLCVAAGEGAVRIGGFPTARLAA